MTKALGKITVTTPGTAVPITGNLANHADPGFRVAAQSIVFEVLPGNTGLVYIQQGGGADDRTNLTRTLAILPAPASATQGPFASYTISLPVAPAGFNAADYYIDAANANQGVLVSIIQN